MATSDLYARKSTRDDGRSVRSQETDWRSDCGDNQLAPGRVFADPDRSASRYGRKSRPDYEALIKYIGAGACEVLSLWEASRGSRNLAEWVGLLDLCRQHGTLIRIISHRRTYDMSLRRDWRTLAEEGVDAHDESERVSERVRRDKRTAAFAGTPAGKLTYGYSRIYNERGKFVEQIEHPDRAPIVREIARRLLAGETRQSIARDLNARGISSPAGKQWSGQHLHQTVCNPAVIGQRVHQGQVIGPGMWPAILHEDAYYRLVAMLGDPTRRTQRGNTMRWWLAGALHCDACDGWLRSHNDPSSPARVRRWRCHTHGCAAVTIAADPVDDYLERAMIARFREPDAATLLEQPTDDRALADAQGSVKALVARLDAHYAEAAAGRLSAGGLAAVEARLLPDLERARAEAQRLAVPPRLRGLAGVDIAEAWPSLPVRTRRDIAVFVADLRVTPAGRPGQPVDLGRLGKSRWRGDTRTWAEL